MEVNAQEIADRILDELKKDAGELWDHISSEGKEEISWAAKRIGKLTLEKLKGEDIADKLDGLEAIIANWSYIHASQAIRAFWRAVDKTVGIVGRFLGEFAVSAVRRL